MCYLVLFLETGAVPPVVTGIVVHDVVDDYTDGEDDADQIQDRNQPDNEDDQDAEDHVLHEEAFALFLCDLVEDEAGEAPEANCTKKPDQCEHSIALKGVNEKYRIPSLRLHCLYLPRFGGKYRDRTDEIGLLQVY